MQVEKPSTNQPSNVETESPPQQQADLLPEKPSVSPRKNHRLWRYLTLITVVWSAVAVAGWFRVHIPFTLDIPAIEFTPDIVFGFGRSLAAVALLIAATLGCSAFGVRILEWLRLGTREANYLSSTERALYGAGLGLGIVSLLVLGIGALGGLYWPVAYAGLALLIFGNWRQSRWLAVGLWRFISKFGQWWLTVRGWERALAVYLIFVGLVTLLLAITPPYSWDTLMYHMIVPRLHVEEHAIRRLFDIVPANYPGGMEMLFTWGLLLLNDGMAQSFHWAYGALGGAGVWVFAMRYFTMFEPRRRQQTALLAVTLYMSVPMVQVLMTWAYTDLMITFCTFMALHAFFVAVDRSKVGGDNTAPWLIAISGIMCGLSFGGKYTAILATAAVFVGGFYYAWQARSVLNWSRFFGWSVIFGFTWLAFLAPWLVRNLIFVGNPIGPLGPWGIKDWHPDEVAPVVAKNIKSDIGFWGIFSRPWELAVTGTQGSRFDGTISPLYIAFLPLWFWAAWRNRLFSALLLASGVVYLGWVATITIGGGGGLEHNRIVLPAFPWLALVTAYIIVRLFMIPQAALLRVFALIGLTLFLVNNVLTNTLWIAKMDPFPYLAGFEQPIDYVRNILPDHITTAEWVNNNLPADSYTYLFFEPRSYYFTRKVAPDLNFGQLYSYYANNFDTPEAVYQELKRRGYTHILVCDWAYKFVTDSYGKDLPPYVIKGKMLLEGLRNNFATRLYQTTITTTDDNKQKVDVPFYSVYKLK